MTCSSLDAAHAQTFTVFQSGEPDGPDHPPLVLPKRSQRRCPSVLVKWINSHPEQSSERRGVEPDLRLHLLEEPEYGGAK